MKRKILVVVVTVIAVAITALVLARRAVRSATPASETNPAEEVEWTCSMHPQIRQPAPGKCPICGMDLIPVRHTGHAAEAARELTLSPVAEKLAEVQLAPVERREVFREIRLVGKIAPDETRLREVTVLTDGRIEKLWANYEGRTVRAGEAVAEIYSPEMLTAARELVVANGTPNLLEAARRKLALLGMDPADIEQIERRGIEKETFTLRSPADAVVLNLKVREQAWVPLGASLMQLADLSTVWALLDVYESDAGLVQVGHPVTLTVDSQPGRRFEGRVTFVSPVLNEETRSIKTRVEIPNPDGALRPGMFVRAVLTSPISGIGNGPPLVIPATAPLLTGRRAIVYVAVEGKPGTYEGHEIELGPRAGDAYVVLAGLNEGERVVVSGNMKLDSTMQIMAKPSMMNPEGLPGAVQHHHGPAASPAEKTADTPEPESGKHHIESSGGHPQETCPVMGGAIDRRVFTDYNGHRVYFCCPACVNEFLKKPEQYMAEMQKAGVQLEKAPEENSHEHH